MTDEKISVVIPVYNVEQYLPRCLDSIVNQTYQNLDIILIDDGSTDSSGHICERYAEKDNRIMIIHKENAGVGAARNDGIDAARGAWIFFVDPDDYCMTNMCEVAVNVGRETKADIVMFDYFRVKSGMQLYHSCYNNEFMTSDKLILAQLQLSILDARYSPFEARRMEGVMWNKMYRTKMLKNCKVHINDRIHIGEDVLFCFEILGVVKKIVYIKQPLYFYRINQGGVTQRFNRAMVDGHRVFYNECCRVVSQYHLNGEAKNAINSNMFQTMVFDISWMCLFHRDREGTVLEKIINAKIVFRSEPYKSVFQEVKMKDLDKSYLRILLLVGRNNIFLFYIFSMLLKMAIHLRELVKLKRIIRKTEETKVGDKRATCV